MARAQPLFQMALWPSGLEFFVHIHVGSGRIDVLHRSSGCICVPSAFWLMHNQHCSIPDRTVSCSRSQVFMWYQRVKRYDWLQVICTGQVDQFVLQPVISWRYLLVVICAFWLCWLMNNHCCIPTNTTDSCPRDNVLRFISIREIGGLIVNALHRSRGEFVLSIPWLGDVTNSDLSVFWLMNNHCSIPDTPDSCH